MNTIIITTCGCGGGMYGPNNLYYYLKYNLSGKIDMITCDTIPFEIEPNVEMLIELIYDKTLDKYHNIYLIGWSMGGATVIETAHQVNNIIKRNRKIKGLILLSTQSGYAFNIYKLDIPILFVHGKNDNVLPSFISTNFYKTYKYDRLLLLIDNCCHNYLHGDVNKLSLKIIELMTSLFNFIR